MFTFQYFIRKHTNGQTGSDIIVLKFRKNFPGPVLSICEFSFAFVGGSVGKYAIVPSRINTTYLPPSKDFDMGGSVAPGHTFLAEPSLGWGRGPPKQKLLPLVFPEAAACVYG